MTISNAELLEIHVLGSSIGESIVLKLPDGKWGVIDCYASSLKDASTNSTLSFLRERGVSELEFLCLTHPHDDHFRGMSQILQQMIVREFWRFAAMSSRQLRMLAHYFKADAEKADYTESKINGDEFVTIFRLVRERRYGSHPIATRRVQAKLPLYPSKSDSTAPFQILGIAPSDRQIDIYETDLERCFDIDGRIRDRLPHSRHNTVSVALMLEYGKTRIILGGDVEYQGWIDVFRDFSTERLSCAAVKVSHHGSTNGYSENLWNTFAAAGKPIALITPFRRFQLP